MVVCAPLLADHVLGTRRPVIGTRRRCIMRGGVGSESTHNKTTPLGSMLSIEVINVGRTPVNIEIDIM
jgi:hypothetical protein